MAPRTNNPGGGLDDAAIAGLEGGVKTDRLAFLEESTKAFFSAGEQLEVSEPLRQHACQIGAFASPKGTLDCIGAFARTDFRDDLRKFTIPTLVIHGDSDATVPFEISRERTAATIPGAKIVVIKHGPHGVNASHVEEFNAALLECLKGRRAARDRELVRDPRVAPAHSDGSIEARETASARSGQRATPTSIQ